MFAVLLIAVARTLGQTEKHALRQDKERHFIGSAFPFRFGTDDLALRIDMAADQLTASPFQLASRQLPKEKTVRCIALKPQQYLLWQDR